MKKGFSTPFEVVGIDSNGEPARMSYVSLRESDIVVNDREVCVKGIQRIVHSTNLPSSWQTYLMDDGHLILRLQIGSPLIVKADNVPQRRSEDDILPIPNIPSVTVNWDEDLELYSRFLDRKDEIKSQYLVYLRSHPEVQELLSDFLKTLLLQKPDNVLDFSINYFKSFSSRTLPNNAFPIFNS